MQRLKNALLREGLPPAIVFEPVPVNQSEQFPLGQNMIDAAHEFAAANPIYIKSSVTKADGIPCLIYEGDSTDYWLSSKKNDLCYQPFYLTWLLSSLALAMKAKSLGFSRLIDIGSGDGRLCYFARLLGFEVCSIELDENLVQLQKQICERTGVSFDLIHANALEVDYPSLVSDGTICFVSALPEIGEMLANAVLVSISQSKPRHRFIGYNFMGSNSFGSMSRDSTDYGWGTILRKYNLGLLAVQELPTQWTVGQNKNTPYLFASELTERLSATDNTT